jgi:hypothetical protein
MRIIIIIALIFFSLVSPYRVFAATENANHNLFEAFYQYLLRRIGPLGGIVGSTGNTGATGVTGLQGATGQQGVSGLQGASGFAGLVGQTGPAGPTGASGLQGSSGPSGVGSSGATGVAGGFGPTGATGGIDTATLNAINTRLSNLETEAPQAPLDFIFFNGSVPTNGAQSNIADAQGYDTFTFSYQCTVGEAEFRLYSSPDQATWVEQFKRNPDQCEAGGTELLPVAGRYYRLDMGTTTNPSLSVNAFGHFFKSSGGVGPTGASGLSGAVGATGASAVNGAGNIAFLHSDLGIPPYVLRTDGKVYWLDGEGVWRHESSYDVPIAVNQIAKWVPHTFVDTSGNVWYWNITSSWQNYSHP